MAKWKQPKKWVSIVSFILCFSILTACAANPEQEVVISKNDGSFDVNVVQSATEPTDIHPTSDATTENNTNSFQHTDTFASTDGSVEYFMEISEDIPQISMPVAQVIPHTLTEEDARQVAHVLFGDADFYELEPKLGGEFCKEDIQYALNMLSEYTSIEKIDSFYIARDYQPEYNQMRADGAKSAVEKYTLLYETAPENNPYGSCQWTFKDDIHYMYTADEIQSGKAASIGNEEIGIRVRHNGIPYSVQFTRRNKDDYKLNNIYVMIDAGLNSEVLRDLYIAQLCATSEPTEEEVEKVKAKAEQMLSDMNLGDWYVDECYIEVRGERYERVVPEYVICINAVPAINGIPAVRRPQLSNLKSEEVYASNYYLTDAEFKFSANGDLVGLEMYSTIDVQSMINDNVATIDMKDLMEIAKTNLSLRDNTNYGLPIEMLESWQEIYGEEIHCRVHVTELEFGLTRVKVPDTDDSYYYVPAVMLSGSVEFFGYDSGNILDTTETLFNKPSMTLLCLNAVDGSVIQLDNE